jgi:hypothetical protein
MKNFKCKQNNLIIIILELLFLLVVEYSIIQAWPSPGEETIEPSCPWTQLEQFKEGPLEVQIDYKYYLPISRDY